MFVRVPKCLNQVFLQQLILAALVACCFLRGLQTVPACAFGVEKSLSSLLVSVTSLLAMVGSCSQHCGSLNNASPELSPLYI